MPALEQHHFSERHLFLFFVPGCLQFIPTHVLMFPRQCLEPAGPFFQLTSLREEFLCPVTVPVLLDMLAHVLEEHDRLQQGVLGITMPGMAAEPG